MQCKHWWRNFIYFITIRSSIKTSYFQLGCQYFPIFEVWQLLFRCMCVYISYNYVIIFPLFRFSFIIIVYRVRLIRLYKFKMTFFYYAKNIMILLCHNIFYMFGCDNLYFSSVLEWIREACFLETVAILNNQIYLY